MICKKCNKPVKEKDKFCRYCGNPIKEIQTGGKTRFEAPDLLKKCTKCRALSPFSSKFCIKCDKPFEKQELGIGTSISSNPQEMKNFISHICYNCGAKFEPNKICSVCGIINTDIERILVKKVFENQDVNIIIHINRAPFSGMDRDNRYFQGLMLFFHMKLEEASSYYEKEINEYPKDYILWNNLGVTFMGLKNRRAAIKCYEKALELRPDNYIVLYNIGGLYNECQRYQEAIKYFDNALNINPDCEEAYYDKAIIQNNLGVYRLEDLERKVSPRVLFNRNSALVDLANGKDVPLGSLVKIIRNFQQIRELKNKGQELEKRGKIKQAVKIFDEGLNLNPDDTSLLASKGAALVKLKKFTEAQACLYKTVRLDPNNILAWTTLAVAESINKKTIEAIKSIEEALRINPFSQDLLGLKKSLYKLIN